MKCANLHSLHHLAIVVGDPCVTKAYEIIHEKESALTRAPLGGGYFEPPLSFSCDIFQTSAGITTKLAVPSLPTILHIVVKFESRGYYSLATNDVRVTSCSADFD